MSLVGNLADLGLGDILQIIALSQKSGTLQLATAQDNGAIVFLQGKVVGAVREQNRVTVGDLLLTKKLVSPGQMQEMLGLQAKEPSGDAGQPPALWQAFSLDAEKVEAALREHLEALIFEMFDWDDGNFSFVIAEDLRELKRLRVASNHFALSHGLNPQFLAIEGSRLRDEKQRSDPFQTFMARSGEGAPESADASESEESFDFEAPPPRQAEPVPAPAKPPPAPAPPRVEPAPVASGKIDLVLIDDDPNILKAMRERFAPIAREVHVFTKVDAGLKRIRELLWGHKQVVVVTDLILPRSDGAGILGGLEVIEKIRPDYPNVPILLLSDYPNEEARARAHKLGAPEFITKPRRTEVEKDKTQAVLEPLLEILTAKLEAEFEKLEAAPPAVAEEPMNEKTERMEPISRSFMPIRDDDEDEDELDDDGGEPEPEASHELPELAVEALDTSAQPLVPPARAADVVDLSQELFLEMGGLAPVATHAAVDPGGREMMVLKSLLFELMNPANRETVTLLVLRYAAELFSRAALLLVTRDELWGLGGFAHQVPSEDFVRLVRRLRVPIDPGSAFSEVLKTRSPLRRTLNATPGENLLAEKLKLDAGQPIFMAPLVSADKVPALLLGDNQQLGKDLGDTHGLEIFLLQAGLAMERTLLERRLKELVVKGGAPVGS